MENLTTLTAVQIAQHIRDGKTTAEAVTRAHLECIAQQEAQVEAWTYLDPDLSIAQAKALDQGPIRGPLHGVPIGFKDIIDTVDMPTSYGSPIHQDRRPSMDASCVALSKKAGAIMLGKTVTTEFANRHPGKSRNPHDANRTPGGSSSGSAAAVGAGMVPLAAGTQTTGSTIRPSSYCGCVGYVPSLGDIRNFGMMEAAGSFDCLGLIGRAVEDIAVWRSVLTDGQFTLDSNLQLSDLRIGMVGFDFWEEFDPEYVACLEQLAAQLSQAGAKVQAFTMPQDFRGIGDAHRWVSSYEFVRNRAWEIEHHWDLISETLRAGRIQDGLSCSFEQYHGARRTLAQYKSRYDSLVQDQAFDLVICPAASGEAPIGLGSTGNMSFSTTWTGLNLPTLTLPLFKGKHGMPLGVQLVGTRYSDRKLLSAGAVIEAAQLAR